MTPVPLTGTGVLVRLDLPTAVVGEHLF